MREQFSKDAIAYGWQALGIRVGIEEGDWNRVGVATIYGDVVAVGDQPVLQILPAATSGWTELIRADAIDRLADDQFWPKSLPAAPFDQIPIMFWGDSAAHNQFALISEDRILQIQADIISATLFMLTRWEEYASETLDLHGRFPAYAAVASRLGFLQRPIIDEYALILKAWLGQLLPDWQPWGNTFQVQLSHDIDGLRRFSPERGRWRPGGGWRTVARELLTGTPVVQLRETWRDIGYSARQEQADSHFQAIRRLAALATRYEFPAAFFFMTADAGQYDDGYQLTSALGQAALSVIETHGHEIGLHPGYETFLNRPVLANEIKRFEAATNLSSYGGRQHYLRFSAPQTWHDWAAAGFAYDSTLGFATAPGFRAGTCFPFNPFDIERDEIIPLEELPLVAMDVTFTSPAYLGLAPAEVIEEITKLARRCQIVGGTFTLLWHNANMNAPWDGVYEAILKGLRRLMEQPDE